MYRRWGLNETCRKIVSGQGQVLWDDMEEEKNGYENRTYDRQMVGDVIGPVKHHTGMRGHKANSESKWP
jgi:hypothetical protein